MCMRVCVCLCIDLDIYYTSFGYPGPFQSTLSSDLALKQIEEHRVQLEALKQEQNTIVNGLAFFRIEQPPSKMIWAMEKVGSSFWFLAFTPPCGYILYIQPDKENLSFSFTGWQCLLYVSVVSDGFVCLCAFPGHGSASAGVGNLSAMGWKLEELAGPSSGKAADAEHGEHGTGHVQEASRPSERSQGEFYTVLSWINTSGIYVVCSSFYIYCILPIFWVCFIKKNLNGGSTA